MQIAYLLVHLIVCVLLIAGTIIQSSRSEGFGSMFGGSSETFHRKTHGFDAFVDKVIMYLAWIFLGTSILSAVILPRFLG